MVAAVVDDLSDDAEYDSTDYEPSDRDDGPGYESTDDVEA